METDTPEPDVHAQLVDVEARITGLQQQLRVHHAEMQELSYDDDPSVLRKNLDIWFDWRLFASDYLLLVRQQRSEARAAFRHAWQRVVSESSQIEMDARLPFTGSYEERRVWYEMKVDHRQRDVDLLDRIADTLIDFIRTLNAAYDHWDKRRIDAKWEAERRARRPETDSPTP